MITPETLTRWIENEQQCLWTDLDHAIRYAANGVWSMGAADFAVRAASAARLVGPSPGGSLPWGLHSGGVIDAVLTVAGIEPLVYPEEEWTRWESTMASFTGGREFHRARYAATVEAIRTDRQLALDLQPGTAETGDDDE